MNKTNKRALLMAGVALLFLADQASALDQQWLNTYAPPVNPHERFGNVQKTDSAVNRPEADKGKVVIKSLQGVIIVEKPSAVKKRGARATGVVVKGDAIPESVKAVAASYIGKEITFGDLDRLSQEIVLAFRAADRPVVNVVMPEQELTNGVLQVLVVVGRLASVKVEGTDPAKAQIIKEEVLAHQKLKEPISEGALLNDLRYFNRNPFFNLSAIYQPGKGYGQTDVILQAMQRKPWLVYAGVESKGDPGPLGQLRPNVGFMATNLLGLGEVYGYQFTTTAKSIDLLRAHVFSFTLPLPGRFQFQALYGRTDTKADFPGTPLTQAGVSNVAGVYLLAPLPHVGRLSHDLRFGAEYKSTNNNIDFGGTAAFAGQAVIWQGVAGYAGEMLSNYGLTHIDGNFYASPGGVSQDNSDLAFQTLRGGAKANYVYARGTIEHRYDFFGGWRVTETLTGQVASANLLPSETLLLGGIGSVRGFTYAKGRGDNGIVSNFALFTPPVSLFQNNVDQFRVYGFFDHGSGWDHSPLVGEAGRMSLTGAGVGATYDIASNASFDFGYGWAVKQTNVTNPSNGAYHLRAIVRY